ncbi:MAG: GNAT family N-acetyltransferase [Myxococcales bacterium]|nr:GNAT family N-acetyltransferase [Myxococcales bacterium]
MTNGHFTIRRATSADLDRLGALAGALVRYHNASNSQRFMLVDGVEAGYARWFARELARPEAVVLAAEASGRIIGYGYGTKEGRDWNMLLDEHGAIHDVFVEEGARAGGVGAALVRALCDALTALGCPRIVLSTMVDNERAQRVFRSLGFRPTMLEMTREADAPK